MADHSVRLPDVRLRHRFAATVDREAKIPHALAELGPVNGRRVVLLDGDDGLRARQLEEMGGVVTIAPLSEVHAFPTASADVAVACWTAIRPGEAPAAEQVAQVMRILDRTGRLLVVHDYGRDDVTALLGSPERESQLLAWSHRHGPFLANGFKLRVLHCWWTWDSVDDAAAFLGEAFGTAGSALAAAMQRPRLRYKVAVYHRDHEGVARPGAAA